jgi:hypothetical protein
MSSSTSPPSYQVIWTTHALQNAVVLRDVAISRGPTAAAELAAALRKIIEALTWVPLD